MLNKFFSSQTLLENGSSPPDKSSLTKNPHVFDSMKTTPKEVFDILCHLKKGKAAGIDEITPDLLCLSASRIAESLSALFNKSFDSSKFPSQWKKALVVPIFKKGDKCCPGNYRPISLLPAISKVLERVVHNKLSDFLRSWLTSNQSGFKKSDGTKSFDLIKAGATQTETSLLKQYVAGERVDLLDAYIYDQMVQFLNSYG